MDNPKYNASGCKDLTAYQAIVNIENEKRAEARFKKVIKTMLNVCYLAGFQVEERIVLRDKKTGRVWR